uniref:Chromosome 12 open reading frame 76 n=1 Tax=Ursus americanus TaxID=9643 RepID=A0A452REJ5_URSAM
MPSAVCWWLYFGLGSLLAGQAEAPSPVEPPERSRPYAVLRGQNLVLMGTIFSILLVTVILMAFCVYKPIRRR